MSGPVKWCPRCEQDVPIENWHVNRARKDGVGIYCKPCIAAYKKVQGHGECAKNKRNAKLQRLYGITVDDFARMLDEQGGGCAICGTPEAETTGARLRVDHDHLTNEVRGLLCHSCNVAIGHLRDSPALLQKAINYLEDACLVP